MIKNTINLTSRTEDGDYIYTNRISCDTIAEAREETKRLYDLVSTGTGRRVHYNVTWIASNGKLVFSHSYMVDQAEVAIEAHNDYVAWCRDSDRESRLEAMEYSL